MTKNYVFICDLKCNYKWLNEYKNFKSLFHLQSKVLYKVPIFKNKNNQKKFQLKEIIIKIF